jgi:uncharacterized LabA/DUF88 family protein
MVSDGITVSGEDEPESATLLFREQADGRKVARLPGGKVVLVDLSDLDRVEDGERWHVKLRHRETFAIAEPIELIRDVVNPVISAALGEALARSLPATREAAPEPEPEDEPEAEPEAEPEDEPEAEREDEPEAEPEADEQPERPSPRPLASVPKSTEANVPHPSPAPQAPLSPRPAATEAAEVTEAAEAADTSAAIAPDKVVQSNERVALFVDGANMDGACRSAGYFVDYLKARKFVVAEGIFVAGYYYIADFTASDPMQLRFMDFLAHAGFIVRRRPVKVIRDAETGERIIKGNLDTEIVLDMLNTVDNYDVAFLLSGDSDFERAIDLLRSRGKRVYVLTSRSSLSREVMYVADKPIFYVEDFRATLIRDDRATPRSAPRDTREQP